MTFHTLATEKLSLSVLPENGAALTDGSFLGKSFLAKPPYPSIVPTHLGTENDWVAAWNGGWQPLLPNAGGEYLEENTHKVFMAMHRKRFGMSQIQSRIQYH